MVRDGDSLLLFLEREDVLRKSGHVVDGLEPGTYRLSFGKRTVKLAEDVTVDRVVLQYNPPYDDGASSNNKFQSELHFDRPIVAVILQHGLFREDVWANMAGIARNLDGFAIRIGGYHDHVHLLIRIPAKITVSDFVG